MNINDSPPVLSVLGVVLSGLLTAVGVAWILAKAFVRRENSISYAQQSLAAVAKSQSDANLQTNEHQATQIGFLTARLDALERENEIQRADNHKLRNYINHLFLLDYERRFRVKEYGLRTGKNTEEMDLILGPELPTPPEPTIVEIVESKIARKK